MVTKRFEIIDKLYLSKALLKMAGGGGCFPHIRPCSGGRLLGSLGVLFR